MRRNQGGEEAGSQPPAPRRFTSGRAASAARRLPAREQISAQIWPSSGPAVFRSDIPWLTKVLHQKNLGGHFLLILTYQGHSSTNAHALASLGLIIRAALDPHRTAQRPLFFARLPIGIAITRKAASGWS